MSFDAGKHGRGRFGVLESIREEAGVSGGLCRLLSSVEAPREHLLRYI